MFSTESNQIINRLQVVLNKPIQTRCAELTVIIDRVTITELQTIFPILIDNIFGPQGTLSWGLRTTTCTTNPSDFQTLQHFFSPLGPFFKLIYSLLNDHLIKYEFGVMFLPVKVRQLLENSSTHPFYSEVVNRNPQTKQIVSLLLNPFDFFIFHFAFHLINPWHQRNTSLCGANWSTVYYVLCCDYVLHFLPTDPTTPILPLLHFYSGKNPVQQIVPSMPRPTRTSHLIKLPIYNESLEYHLQQSCDYHPRSQIWRSETVLTAFIDLWLNNDNINQVKNFSMSPTRQPIQFSDLPTGEYIRIIRVLVKQVHAFASSSKIDDTHLGELKKIAVPMMQGKLYMFLRNLVHRWPLDGSFRLVLELWLSFIQPWRYPGTQQSTKIVNRQELNADVEEMGSGPMKSVDREYLPFIAENLLAYVVIFQQLLPRFGRIDLSSPKMSLMLYRLTKVFDQPNLVNLLKEVEMCVQNNPSPTHSYNSSLWDNTLPPLSPTSNWSTNTSFNGQINASTNRQQDGTKSWTKNSKWSSVVRQKILEFEGPNFCYKPLFNAPVASEVYDLIVQVKKAQMIAESVVQARLDEIKNQNFYSQIKSFFMYENSADEFSLEERKKVPVYLNYALQHLKDMFQIEEIPNYEPNHSETTNSSEGISIINDLRCLTPEKVRERRNNITYQGNPDTVSARSDEVEFLVIILCQLSTLLNSNFQEQICRFYHKPGYLGKLARQLIYPPVTYYKFDKSQGRSVRVACDLPPRLNLRCLAKYKLVVYLSLGIGLGWLGLYSLRSFSVFILTSWIIYIFLKALFSQDAV